MLFLGGEVKIEVLILTDAAQQRKRICA